MKLTFLKNLFFACTASIALCAGVSSCGNDEEEIPEPSTRPVVPPVTDPDETFDKTFESKGFARGADISWVTELEQKGYQFYPRGSETPKELTKLLRNNCGVNAIRLRVWVNPTGGWCGLNDVVAKARRAKDLRMRVMIDFHLSNSWADPGKQYAPIEWASYTPEQTANAISTHVNSTLQALKNEGVNVCWVQIGNETTPGMLHELGGKMEGSNAGEFPRYLNAGYDAVKAVYPDAQVIVHLDKGQDADTYNWFFDLLNANGGRYDMIGMSLYPEIETGSGSSWKVSLDNKAIDDCIANIKALNTKYGKKIIMSEIGFHYTNYRGGAATLTKFLKEFSSGNVLDGIFYWEPEAPEQEGYKKGAFDNNRPTPLFDAFLEKQLTPVQP